VFKFALVGHCWGVDAVMNIIDVFSLGYTNAPEEQQV
jgi:hypothetical protein